MKNDNNLIIEKTIQWLTQSVIKYQFCPYAKQPFQQQAIAYHIYNGQNIVSMLEKLAFCCIELDTHKQNELETSLLVIAEKTDDNTKYLNDFYDYLDALDIANEFLASPKKFTAHFSPEFQVQHFDKIPDCWENKYQLASFHPDYQFENSDDDERENYTNRSPYPIFHIIRNISIEHVRINDSKASEIVKRNIETLSELSDEAFSLLKKLAHSNKN